MRIDVHSHLVSVAFLEHLQGREALPTAARDGTGYIAHCAPGLSLPYRHITVNLAPADVVKEGSHFDLPIALALLAAMEVLPPDELGGYTRSARSLSMAR